MRAAGITAIGGPVEILEVDEPEPPAVHEVLIDVAMAGIGNWDELVRIGSWRIGGPAPMALGTEAAGTVVAVGSHVTGLREGDEVMTHPLPLRRHGTWAEGCSRRRRLSRAGTPQRPGKSVPRFLSPRSPRLRHSRRLLRSRAVAGSSSTEPA